MSATLTAFLIVTGVLTYLTVGFFLALAFRNDPTFGNGPGDHETLPGWIFIWPIILSAMVAIWLIERAVELFDSFAEEGEGR